MAGEKIDHRVLMTKALLRNALVKLMRDQHISKISVRNLCDEAGINRSTFYAHYEDQYDLLAKVEQEVIDNLKAYLEEQDFEESPLLATQVLKRILDYAKENADLFKALLSENCDFAVQRDVIQLTQIVSPHMYKTTDRKTREYLQEFGVMGCISVLQKWLQDGMQESTEQMTELLLRALYSGLGSF